MEFQESFGIRIAARRKEFHLTQQQLGDLVGLSKQAINDIEHGRRSTVVVKALAIAAVLNTTVEYIAGVTDNPDYV